jgi:hydrogenase-4 component B
MTDESLLAAPLLIAASLAVPALAALWALRRSANVDVMLWTAPLPALICAALVLQGSELSVSWLLLGARLGMDGLSAPLLVLTGLVWLGAGLALPGYAGEELTRRIAPFWLAALAGNVGLVLALDQVTFFVFFTLMSFASYALVVARSDSLAMRAGRRYMVFVIVGEVLLFNALVLQGTGHEEFRALFLLAGFGIKAALLGLHAWLPLAHTAAPAPASAVLSGAMVAAGTLGWLRFVQPGALPAASTVVAVLGISGALYATVMGLLQRHPKAVLAYSSVAQLGLVAVAVAAHLNGSSGAAALAAFYLLHHGLAKAALFVGVGLLERLRGPTRWAIIFSMLLASAAIVGLPLSSGAGLKVTLKATVAADLPTGITEPIVVLLAIASLGSTLLMARFLALLPVPREAGRVNGSMYAGFFTLVGCGLILATVLPVPRWSEMVALLLPFAAGVGVVSVAWTLAALGWLPALCSRCGEAEENDGAPIQLLRVSIVPAIGIYARQKPSPEQSRLRLSRLSECATSWMEKAENSFRNWLLPGVAMALIALFLVASLSADRL